MTNEKTILKLCSGCHSTRELNDFDYNKKGVCFKTCNNCRARNKNKNKIINNKNEYYNINIEETPTLNANNSDLSLSDVTKNEFIRAILNYIPNEKIKFLKCVDTINDYRMLKLIFTKRRSMIILCCGDKWLSIKKLIDNELKPKTSRECSICCEPYAYLHEKAIDMFPRIHCKTCFNDWCMECQFSIMYKNKGVIACPYCRVSVDYQVGECKNCLEDYTIFLTQSLAGCSYDDIPFGFSRSF